MVTLFNLKNSFYAVLLSASDCELVLLPLRHHLLSNIQDGGQWQEAMIT